MNALFELSAPWWQFVLRAAVVFIGVLFLMRLSGKRTLGQFTPFDLIMLILIGNAVQNGMNGGDNSLTAAVLLSLTLVVLNTLMAFATTRSRKLEKLIEGDAVILARDGKVFRDRLNEQLISKSDFNVAMREEGIGSIDDIAIARLETNGKISFERRPAASGD